MNLTQILDEVGIAYCQPGQHHHVRDGWIGLTCPWCPAPYGEKGRYRLGIETSTGRVNCWVCGRHSFESVLVECGKISFKAAKALLQGIKLKAFSPQRDHLVKTAGKVSVPVGVGPMLESHKSYLEHRGLDLDSVERLWKVQGIGLAAEFQWRLFIPITLNGEMVSWTTRTIGNGSMRYISAKPDQEKIHLKDTLYGIDLVRTTIILVEGPTDVWNVGPGAAAMFGLNYSPAQLDLISRFPHKVICFDNEPDAQKRANGLCEMLSLLPGRVTNVCLDAEDPGAASKQEIKRLREAVL